MGPVAVAAPVTKNAKNAQFGCSADKANVINFASTSEERFKNTKTQQSTTPTTARHNIRSWP
jgi:hypothetical protein